MSPLEIDLGEAAGRLLGLPVRRALAVEAGRLRARLTAPWREGAPGPAAEAGRWIGVGLAAAAFLVGVAAAVYVTRED